MMAMLFLILFSVLALGFYSMVTTSQQVAGSEQRVAHAFTAAESGMEFMRYQLSRVVLPSGTTESNMISETYADLQSLLNGSGNLAGNSLALSSDVIYIPSGTTNYITIDSNSKFRATVRRNLTSPTNELIVHTVGVYGSKNATRAIEMRFKPQFSSDFFTYSMASAGGITMTNGTVTDTTEIQAGLMTTYTGSPALNLTGGTLEGEIAVTGSTSQINLAGTSVSGTTNSTTILSDYTHILPPPPLPTFNTDVFAPYATNTWTNASKTPFINTRVPAGKNPSFKGGDVIEGILYIESPNTVEFKGDVIVRGMIIFQNTGTDAVNTMEFKGSAFVEPVPDGAAYDSLRAITGIGILAPTTAVTFKGESGTSVEGSIIVSKFVDMGSADIAINNGSLIATSPTANAIVLGGQSLTFSGNASYNPPSMGVVSDQKFEPQPRTYLEVSP